MKVSRGYKIPEVPEPDGLRCVRVFIPDDDLYLYALMGAYEYFGTWTAWEKDGTTRASQAASAWKTAYEETRANITEECISMSELSDLISLCCDAITSGLQNIANSVSSLEPTATGGCGCIPITDETIQDEEGESYDTGGGEYPPDFEGEPDPVGAYQDSACKTAYALADVFISVYAKLATGGGVIAVGAAAATISLFLSLIVPGAIVITAAGLIVIVTSLISLVGIGGFTFEIFSRVSVYLLTNRDSFACAFYSGDGTSDKVSQVLNFLELAVDDAIAIETPDLQNLVKPHLMKIAEYLASNATINRIFELFVSSIYDTNEQYDDVVCDCGGEPPSYDYVTEDGMNGNDIAPWIPGIAATLHINTFYSGDGHIALKTAGTNISSVTVTNSDWCSAFFISNPTQKVLRRIVVDAALTNEHSAQPPSGELKVTIMPGTAQETVQIFDALPINDYVECIMTGAWSWDVGEDQVVVKLEQVNSSTFQAELKIGAVEMDIDELV